MTLAFSEESALKYIYKQMAEKDHPHATHRSQGGISKNEVALPSLDHFPQGSLFNPQQTQSLYL